MARFTRNSNNPDPDVVFPCLEGFSQPTMLPMIGDVIGIVRFLMARGVKGRAIKIDEALQTVSEMVYERYKHDTVYCVRKDLIKRRLKKIYEVVKEARRRLVTQGRKSCEKEYLELATNSGKLFDVSDVSAARAKECQIEFGVKMSENERNYLADQKSERRWSCSKNVDPIWARSII